MNEKNNFTFWASILALVLSIGLIFTWLWTTNEISIVDSNTFFASCTAVITIAVTFAVGYQIFNVIDMRQKLTEIETLKRDLNSTIATIHQLGYSSLSRSFDALAKATFSINDKAYQAFYYGLQSLYFALLSQQSRQELILRIMIWKNSLEN